MRWLFVGLMVMWGCGPAGPEPRPSGDDETAKAAALVKEAKAKREAGAFREARDRLAEAYRFSDAEMRSAIDRENEQLDQAETERAHAAAKARVADGDCVGAMTAVTEALEAAGEAPQLPGMLRSEVEATLVGCVTALADDGELAAARAAVDDPAMATALEPSAGKKLKKAVSNAVVDKLMAGITKPSADGDWVAASAVLADALAADEAGEAEVKVVLASLRKGIATDVKALCRDSFGTKGAAEGLTRVDALVGAGRWTEEDPAPEALGRCRRELSFSIACDAVRCRKVAAKARWLYGDAELTLLTESDPQTLKHGRKVWVVAEGARRALVAFEEPETAADLAALAHVGDGWLAPRSLVTRDTSTELPPGASIVGVRVWGPLRDGAKAWELGTVTAVDGLSLRIERMSDRKPVTVPRRAVRFGVTAVGTKVLAQCKTMDMHQARIDAVKEVKHRTMGDPTVTLTCFDDTGAETTTYDEQLGAVRMDKATLK